MAMSEWMADWMVVKVPVWLNDLRLPGCLNKCTNLWMNALMSECRVWLMLGWPSEWLLAEQNRRTAESLELVV